jgi:hypothetical protein
MALIKLSNTMALMRFSVCLVLQVNQIYKKVVEGTTGTINYAATTTPYK